MKQTQKTETMKFEIKSWLTENRETIIAKYKELTNEQFFSGITMRDFMVKILSGMTRNNVRSAKRAEAMLQTIMSDIYFNNSTVPGNDTELNNTMISNKGQLPSSMR